MPSFARSIADSSPGTQALCGSHSRHHASIRCGRSLPAIRLLVIKALPMAFILTSPAFASDHKIPAQYTCDGVDTSPPLSWSDAPRGTRSFALIVDDPDAPDPKAPKMTWVHWVLYDIPAAASGLPEAVEASALPSGTREGVNDWGRTGFGGPGPPIGPPRYFHKLHAR